MKNNLLKTVFALALVVGAQTQLHAQGTAFTYQGRLNFNGAPAAGNFDLRLAVFDANTNGNQFGDTLTNSTTTVTNGLFTVTLDFGAGIFTGPDRWLEIAARTNGGGAFTLLTPRQAITPMPYALFANTASNVLGVIPSSQITGTISPAQLPANVITNAQTGVTLGGTFSGNGSGLTNLNASSLTTGTVPTNVLAGFQAPYYAFIGGGQNNTALNTYAVVAGGANNNATYLAAAGGGYNNNASGYYSTIPGGYGNLASGQNSFAAGQQAQAVHQGAFVWADSQPATFASVGRDTFNVRAGGGVNFQTAGSPITVNGQNLLTTAIVGNFWQTTGNAGTSPANGNFFGTTDNQPLEIGVNGVRAQRIEPTANGVPNLIGGSAVNFVSVGTYGATIGGGGITNYQGTAGTNSVSANFATIGGGAGNMILTADTAALIGGGRFNVIMNGALSSVIGGGAYNQIQPNALDGVIVGGIGNIISSNASFGTIAGGANGTVSGSYSTVGGGNHNLANGSYATVAGGFSNQANGVGSFIGGGGADGSNFATNIVNSPAASIVGGLGNSIDINSDTAVISGGAGNTVSQNSQNSVIAGGLLNFIAGGANVIGGGAGNVVSAGCNYSTIPGGNYNFCYADYAFAAGYNAIALHPGTFVWADAQLTTFQTTTSNQFAVRASGGVLFNVGTNNVELASGGLKVTGAGINTGTAAFTHLTSASTVAGNQTTINNALCNNQPNAILIVTHNYNPGGASVSTLHNHAVGVFYSSGKWKIYNEDIANMATNIAFNVLIIKN